MSGIAGIYAYHYAANAVDRAELRRIRDHMASRGPGGSGEWYTRDERIGLGHRRLPISGSSECVAQPTSSADSKIVITFDGKIYNYRELRTELEAKGHRFHSDAETDVLLCLYAEKGEAMVKDLRGMFAFGLWDAAKGALLLARDPYGIKPLYYADDGWTLRFASQVKALLASGRVSRTPEPAGWVGFYLFGAVPDPFTTYQDVRALEAGCTLWIDRVGVHAPKPYFSIAEEYCRAESADPVANEMDRQLRFRGALVDSIRSHLADDAPAGAFLSDDVDAAVLLSLMRDAGQRQIQTISLAFDDPRGARGDEISIPEQIAARYRTRHTTRRVNEHEFREDLPKILDAMDQPTIGGIDTWFLAKAARELGLQVAIFGLGGDELFGRHTTFRDVPRNVRALAAPGRIAWLGPLGRRLLTSIGCLSNLFDPRTMGILEYGGTYAGAYLLCRGVFMPWELDGVIGADVARSGLRRLKPLDLIEATLQPMPKSAFAKVATFESSLRLRNQLLRDADWASMAHSIEVRFPLADVKLLSRLAAIASSSESEFKRLLAASLRLGVEPEAVGSRKAGLGSPIQSWLQQDTRMQRWRHFPTLANEQCAWAKRWAFQVSAI